MVGYSSASEKSGVWHQARTSAMRTTHFAKIGEGGWEDNSIILKKMLPRSPAANPSDLTLGCDRLRSKCDNFLILKTVSWAGDVPSAEGD